MRWQSSEHQARHLIPASGRHDAYGIPAPDVLSDRSPRPGGVPGTPGANSTDNRDGAPPGGTPWRGAPVLSRGNADVELGPCGHGLHCAGGCRRCVRQRSARCGSQARRTCLAAAKDRGTERRAARLPAFGRCRPLHRHARAPASSPAGQVACGNRRLHRRHDGRLQVGSLQPGDRHGLHPAQDRCTGLQRVEGAPPGSARAPARPRPVFAELLRRSAQRHQDVWRRSCGDLSGGPGRGQGRRRDCRRPARHGLVLPRPALRAHGHAQRRRHHRQRHEHDGQSGTRPEHRGLRRHRHRQHEHGAHRASCARAGRGDCAHRRTPLHRRRRSQPGVPQHRRTGGCARQGQFRRDPLRRALRCRPRRRALHHARRSGLSGA